MSSLSHPGGIVRALPLALALAGGPGGLPPAFSADGFGRVTLASSEVIAADVLKEYADIYVLRTVDGLRVVEKSSVAKVEAAAASGGGPRAPAPPAAGPKEAAPPAPKASGPAEPSPAGGPSEPVIREWADPRLDEARQGGTVPVIEIALSGSIDKKAIDPLDGVFLPKLTYFLSEESRPRFEVLPPEALRAEKTAKAKPAGKKAPGGEYIARVVVETTVEDLTFYGKTLTKTVRTRTRFTLERSSDAKVIAQVDAVDDGGADPKDRDAACRASHARSAEALAARLKTLKTFGGSP